MGLEVAACNQVKENRAGRLPESEKTEWDRQKRWEGNGKGSRRPTNTQHAHTHTKEYHRREGAQMGVSKSECKCRTARACKLACESMPAC
eukprot:5029667-Pleurochrysis_carterae.AAC.1